MPMAGNKYLSYDFFFENSNVGKTHISLLLLIEQGYLGIELKIDKPG